MGAVTREPRPTQCSSCGVTTVARIIRGLVIAPMPGKVVYGGCCVPEKPPKWGRQTCHHEWGLDEDTDDNVARSE